MVALQLAGNRRRNASTYVARRARSDTSGQVDARARGEVEPLAEQQAALRRLATLVAEGAAATELYSAVAGEAALVLGVSAVMLGRYEADLSVMIVASLNEPGFPVGSRWPLDGPSVGAA